MGLAYGLLAGVAALTLGPSPLWPVHLALVALFVIGGSVLSGLGVVGEYVGRIYEQVKGRPLYLVKESFPAREAQAAPVGPKDYRNRPSSGASAA
jgi:hypothetical protein